MNFHERKEHRKKYYFRWVYGWKERECIGCMGSGYYDHNGSPPCSGCDGTGKEKYQSEKSKKKLEELGYN